MLMKLGNYLKENIIGKDLIIEIHGSISCLTSIDDVKLVRSTQHEIILEGQSQNFTIWIENIEEIKYHTEEFDDDDDSDLYIGFKDGLGIWFNIID